jgi:MSHA pilin protein MshB
MKMLNVKKMGGAAKQAGFTIIELVVVILLLGILTATALPRFLDISDDAHEAVVDAHLGALSTGVALYRAAWFANSKPLAAAVDYDGAGAAVNQFASALGYPLGETDPTGTTDEPLTSANCASLFNNLLQSGGTAQTAVAMSGAGTSTIASASGAVLVDGTTPFAGDWAAAVVITTGDANNTCDYYYMGQFNTPASTPRVINYNPATGAMTVATSAALATGA